jgi:hypothetical protein
MEVAMMQRSRLCFFNFPVPTTTQPLLHTYLSRPLFTQHIIRSSDFSERDLGLLQSGDLSSNKPSLIRMEDNADRNMKIAVHILVHTLEDTRHLGRQMSHLSET